MINKKHILIRISSLTTIVLALLATACTNKEKWVLEWEENFDAPLLDDAVWSRIPRGPYDWSDRMSLDDACYELRNGNLVLKGIMNPDTINDPVPHITGGVYTLGKRAFHGGRLEIRAKLQNARGAWPAIWMKPFDTSCPWPMGGEIDIMEHLNHDTVVWQTVHSHYTQNLRIKENPLHTMTSGFKTDEYNTYAVEMYKDSLIFYVNDNRTLFYPRIESDQEGQYPFDRPYYLLMDMQLGGNWVGGVSDEDLPVEMSIDWVRYYRENK